MKKTFILLLVVMLQACNNSENNTATKSESGEVAVHKSEKINGKWTTDRSTAEELKGMHYTIENFTLLNKKKFENLAAYQEFGNLLQNHIDRVSNYCRLDPDSKDRLCQNLNRIKEPIKILRGDDIVKSKEALHTVNLLFSEIDSTFDYTN